MKITSLLPSTLWPNEALAKLLQGSSLESSQGLSDLFILATLYLGIAFLVGALYLTLRSCLRTIRYRRRLSGIKDYSAAQNHSVEMSLFHFFGSLIIIWLISAAGWFR